MASKQEIPVIGLNTTVYGLDEYNKLPKGTPVSVMFALHGRLREFFFIIVLCSKCVLTDIYI